MFFACYASAEPIVVNEFPDPNATAPAQMLENRVYTAAATATNMDGVYENGASVNALANFETAEFAITYVLNGGKNSANNPDSYNIDNLPITLENATRDGDYIFAGWCTDENLTENCTIGYEIAAGTTGDLTLYAKWEEAKFSVTVDENAPLPAATTTTQKAAMKDKFSFYISAAGTFYVDWGDGIVDKIVRNDVREEQRTHTYTDNKNVHIIRFSGHPTGYNRDHFENNTLNSGESTPTIRFFYKEDISTSTDFAYMGRKITSMSGSLGALFPTLQTAIVGRIQPSFAYTFYGCTNMDAELSPDLFKGIYGAPMRWMFKYTFAMNYKLHGSIPANLFSGLYGKPAKFAFWGTFAACTGLTGSIPESLFCHALHPEVNETPGPTNCIYGKMEEGDGLTASDFNTAVFQPNSYARDMFRETFYGCTGLTGGHVGADGKIYAIPPRLFAGIHGAPVEGMFDWTFDGCTGLTGNIPESLFCYANYTGAEPSAENCIYGAPQSRMFRGTFSKDENLTGSIPEKLFAGIHGAPAYQMFRETFYNCKNLSGSIPESLFCYANYTGAEPTANNCIFGAPQSTMFEGVFQGCAGLTGSIPEKLFAGIRGAPAYQMFYGTFASCENLSGSIPANLFSGIHGAPAAEMFVNTFGACENLSGSIPESLFCQANATGEEPNVDNCIFGAPQSTMFYGTFNKCYNLNGTIPEKLFAGIRGAPAYRMFEGTFNKCYNLEGSIPPKLFAGIHGAPATEMFYYTFRQAKNLTGKIPETLFCQNPDNPNAENCIYGAPAAKMFYGTFESCENLSGFTDGENETTYVPASFLAGISDGSAADQVTNMFTGTALDDTCPINSENQPIGTFNVTRSQFSTAGKPWCSPCPENFPNIVASATDASQCYAMCPTMENATAASGGVYQDGTNTCEITECKDGFVLENSTCVGKIINIDWAGTNDSDVENGANMCIYGGTITAPSAASAINPPKGKRFVGWRVKKS